MPARISHWINATPVVGTSGRFGPVYNPATGEQTGEVDSAGAFYTRTKVVTARWPDPVTSTVDLGFPRTR